jgi:hypothetical protein
MQSAFKESRARSERFSPKFMPNRLLRARLLRAVFAIALMAWSAPAWAQLPLIRLDRIFPLGGAAGSEVVLEIQGRDLEEANSLRFDHPGLKATPGAKPNQFKVTIAPEVPPGSYEMRAVGKYGITGARLFAVQHGLAEVLEKEPNDEPAKANEISINSAVNGQSDGNGDDYFRFAGKKRQRVVIDCYALRLDSTLRAQLSLLTSDGKILQSSRPYYHRTDTLLDVVLPEDGAYLVRLHDAIFNGGLPYRLLVSDRPQLENAFPSAIEIGKSTQVQVVGRNLPSGKSNPARRILDQAMDEATITVAAPDEAKLGFKSLVHLGSANANVRGFQWLPSEFKNALNPLTFAVADAPVVLDKEPNNTPESAQTITLPAVVCGRFDVPGDADWLQFTAKSNEQFSFDLLCERIDLPGDPFVVLFDGKGNELTSFDDHGINFNALAQFNRDPLGTWRAPADGTYRVLVQDRYGAGGPRHQYALRIAKAEPDLFPVVCHETPGMPTAPCVRQGGSAFYEICLNRRDFSGPVTIEAEGLPPGLTVATIHMSPQTQTGTIVLTAAPDAPEWSGAIKLKATGSIDGKTFERPVRCVQRRWPIDNVNTSVAVREIVLAIRSKAPYGLQSQSEPAKVTAGGSAEFAVRATRHWPDFKGPIQVNGLNLPPGFSVAAATFAADQTEIKPKLTVAANVPPGTYSIVLRGDAQVPFSRDEKATTRPNVRVADPTTPLAVIVEAAMKK